MSRSSLDLVREVVEQFPPYIRPGQLAQIDRFAFEVDLVRSRVPAGATVRDIGSGWGAFGLGCAAAGLKVTIVDDFGDAGFHDPTLIGPMRALWAKYGVEMVERSATDPGKPVPDNSLDAVTTFGCIEHWHHSPKAMLHDVVRSLKPGGLFVAGTPNSANLRKRITGLIGKSKWSAMSDWYEQEVFRGHVREPDVDDLRYIARDMKLVDVKVIGRNFAGYHPGRPAWIRAVTPFVDQALRLRPSLCSDIYVLGFKPSS
jgi:SAM-dependent methyltransferase